MDPATEKLQKVLAARGLGSRREMERWIEQGRIVVDGDVASLGQRVDASAAIEVDGRPIAQPKSQHSRILVLNKRVGTVVSRKDDSRETVFEGLPELSDGRWIAVGRLDISTAGMLLFTNDGTLAHRLMHPSTGIDREYAVRVEGKLEAPQLDALRAGVDVDGTIESFSDIRYYDGQGSNHWYHVCLMEGRNREVRRLFGSQGVNVSRLKRVRYGPVVLPSWLKRGQLTEMAPDDVAQVYRLLGLKYSPPRAPRSFERSKQRMRSLLIPYPDLAVTRSKS